MSAVQYFDIFLLPFWLKMVSSLVQGYYCDVCYEFSSTTVIYSVYMCREIRRPHCLRPEKRPNVLGVASAGK